MENIFRKARGFSANFSPGNIADFVNRSATFFSKFKGGINPFESDTFYLQINHIKRINYD